MVVCLCAGSTQGDIERALEAGAGSLAEIGDSCRAGLDCGGCHSTLREMLCRRSCESCPERHSLEFARSSLAGGPDSSLGGSQP
jgi:bacterioferritin-associated ferredoxin